MLPHLFNSLCMYIQYYISCSLIHSTAYILYLMLPHPFSSLLIISHAPSSIQQPTYTAIYHAPSPSSLYHRLPHPFNSLCLASSSYPHVGPLALLHPLVILIIRLPHPLVTLVLRLSSSSHHLNSYYFSSSYYRGCNAFLYTVRTLNKLVLRLPRPLTLFVLRMSCPLTIFDLELPHPFLTTVIGTIVFLILRNLLTTRSRPSLV